jgi:hypothetical protein
MKTSLFRFALLAAIAVSLGSGIGAAQSPADEQSTPSAYRPGLGDLMTMTVQPRHTKLALAAQAKNWTYAAYELHELEEAFDRAARAWPEFRSAPITEMVRAVVDGPMADLAQAIKSADSQRFTAAYSELTDACNACHQATSRGFVVIQTPAASSFPDQDFRRPQR